MTEIATERNCTIIFPIPVDLINRFLGDQPAATAYAENGTKQPVPSETHPAS